MSLTYSSGFSEKNLRQNLFTRENVFNAKIKHIMEDGAEKIKEKSQSNAPVDTHNLELAHKIIPGQTRKGYTSLSVEVSGHGQGSDRDRDVTGYALLIHEFYNIVPELKMGPKSAAKLAAGHEVGNKFLERAVDKYKPVIIAECKKALKDSF